ncbi:MAG: DoxX family membrane protein, partial [Candidatus Krumholzibacteria bacterium]|nr:DoxX family membrane protein [Candidatus Krumholzibacteria bacterium]
MTKAAEKMGEKIYFKSRPAGAGEASASWIFNPYLLCAFRLILAAVFIYAALLKIGKPLLFADEIRMYRILDLGPLLYIVAIALPWIELFCGISLVIGVFIRGSALILLVLSVVFLVAVSIRTAGVMYEESLPFLKVYFDCGCGFGETYAWKKLLEDSIFFLIS